MTRLIWSTPNGEELLVYMARVSNPEGQERGDSPERLIRLYMVGTLRSWLHFCSVRSGEDTQRETRQIAHEVADLLREEFPATWQAFEEHEALEARVRHALDASQDPTTLNIGGGER